MPLNKAASPTIKSNRPAIAKLSVLTLAVMSSLGFSNASASDSPNALDAPPSKETTDALSRDAKLGNTPLAKDDNAEIPPSELFGLTKDFAPWLRLDRRLAPFSTKFDRSAPRFFSADFIEGVGNESTKASGNVTFRTRGLAARSDTATFTETDETLLTEGNVKIDRAGDLIVGPRLRYRLPDHTGEMTCPSYRFNRRIDPPLGSSSALSAPTATQSVRGSIILNPIPGLQTGQVQDRNLGRDLRRNAQSFTAFGTADEVKFEGENRYRVMQGNYTTCAPEGVAPAADRPAWRLRVKEMELDRTTSVGTAYNATVEFKGIPILYAPVLTFPLSDERKSGFLAPTFGGSSRAGFQVWVPYYWNIAPNYDATITPKILTRRGLMVANEFRYLQPSFQGQAEVEWLPQDRIKKDDRFLLSLKHTHALWPSVLPGLGLSINAQKASDDDFFRDLTSRIQLTSQVNLPRDLAVTYNRSTPFANWGFVARSISYQTLQDPNAPVPIPYKLVPAIVANGEGSVFSSSSGLGLPLRWRTENEVAHFKHPTLVSGQRFLSYTSLTAPIERPWGFMVPKLGLHLTRYNLSANKTAFDADRYSRNLPVLSFDSGLVFDRKTQWGSRAATQTLEPRAYYVRIPFRDQSRLPNFSSAVSDFNFAQLFTENQFVGGDRVNDADQLTLAMTSRFTDDASGEELLRWGLGQRFYFRSPRVSLAGEAPELRQTDLLATAAGQPLRHVFLDATAQVNTNTRGLEKLLVGVRYNPAPDRILNAAYRYTRNDIVGDGLKLIDLQALWPLNWGAGQQRLYGIGRYNYSIRDRKMVEGLAGIEYNAGCWKVRALAHRFTTAKDQQTTNFFIQLELVGLSRIGINPLETLRQNIAGYRRFESQSRFGDGLDTAQISPRQESCK